MKILLLLPDLLGGGAQRSLVNLALGLVNLGEEVKLVIATSNEAQICLPENIPNVFLNSSRVLYSIPKITSVLKKENPDVFISTLNYVNVAARLACFFARYKGCFIVREANVLLSLERAGLPGKILIKLMSWAYKRSQAVIVNSENTRWDLISRRVVSHKKIINIANPIVDNNLYKKQAKHSDHPWLKETNLSDPVIVTIGRLTYQKGYDLLIQAFAQLVKKKNAKLIILGEGEQRAKLETLAKELHIAEHISMPGFVENPHPYLLRADLFVLSSRWEGLPSVLIEAMAANCEIVATDCPGGVSDFLEQGKFGKLVPIENVELLEEAMHMALNISDFNSLFKEHVKKYSIENISKSYLSLFESFQKGHKI